MSRTSINVLARYREEQKRKRERRLTEAHAKVDPVQRRLELDEPVYTARDHERRGLELAGFRGGGQMRRRARYLRRAA